MIFFDFETKSYNDLKKTGAWPYSEDPTTDAICACFAVDDGPIHSWTPDNREMETYLFGMIAHGHQIEAYNVSFERAIWQNVMTRRYGWKLPRDDQWEDLMAVASYYAMPSKLDRLARAVGLPGKDPEGARLITKYSKLHLKTAKLIIPPEDMVKWLKYCGQDVDQERQISNYLGDLPEREKEVFRLDQTINMRGIYLDEAGLEAAIAIVEQRAIELASRFRQLTGGINPTQRDKAMEWFAANGLKLDNMQADYLEELLDEGEIPQGPAREALEIRLRVNKASTKKLDAMLRNRASDGRARFQTRYHGAGTGRWTGTGFQPLNLNKGFAAVSGWEDFNPDYLVRDIMYRDPRWLDAIYGDATDVVGKASRHWLQAGAGNRLIAGDFVSIEAVLLACLAGEDWKIEAFRQKKPIYEIMGAKIHGLPEGTVTKKTHPEERQDGKTGELAFGYQGALGAWLKFDSSGRHSDERIIEICKSWRGEHPMTTRLWCELEDAAIEAVRQGEGEYGYRQISFEMVDAWLSMILPDGKRIWYFDPQLRTSMPHWHQPATKDECADGSCSCRPRPQLTYLAQKEGQWKRVDTYGGKLTENATQATSRQVLVPAMLRAEKAGYHVILSVYDEIVAENPIDFGSKKEFEQIMAESPGDWARGWPIMVDAWEGERYRK